MNENKVRKDFFDFVTDYYSANPSEPKRFSKPWLERELMQIDGVMFAQMDETGLLELSPCVVGGESKAIAEKLLSIVPSGCVTRGEISVEVNDSEGIPHIISFSRPPAPAGLTLDTEISV